MGFEATIGELPLLMHIGPKWLCRADPRGISFKLQAVSR